jgi:hypothetical protein
MGREQGVSPQISQGPCTFIEKKGWRGDGQLQGKEMLLGGRQK